MTYKTMKLNSVYFKKVATGAKTVEGRINKPSLHSLKENDIIRFLNNENEEEFIEVRINYLKQYSTFHDMLLQEGLQACLPGVLTLDEGVKTYHQFPSYKEGEKELGVLAIGITLLTSD